MVYVVNNNAEIFVGPILLVKRSAIQICVLLVIKDVVEASSQLIGLELPVTTEVHDLEDLSQRRFLFIVKEQVSNEREACLLQDNLPFIILAEVRELDSSFLLLVEMHESLQTVLGNLVDFRYITVILLRDVFNELGLKVLHPCRIEQIFATSAISWILLQACLDKFLNIIR